MRPTSPLVAASSLLLALVTIGCVTTLATPAREVRIVTDHEKETACSFLGVATASHATGWTNRQDVESVLNQLRNKTVKMGGNAMKLIQANTTGNWFEGSMSMGSAEVLRCDFARLDALRATSAPPVAHED